MPYELTWQFDANRSYTPVSAADLTKYQIWYLASFLLGYIGGATLGLWTCMGSSDGVTGAMDATFRWGTPGTYDGTKIVQVTATPASSAHSWIVLRSPVMPDGGYCYILIDAYSLTNPNGYGIFTARTPWLAASTGTFQPINAGMSPATTTAAGVQTNDATTTARFFNGCLATNGNFIVFDAKSGSGFVWYMTMWHNVAQYQIGDAFPFYNWRFYQTAIPGVGYYAARSTGNVAYNAARAGHTGQTGYNLDPFSALPSIGGGSVDQITGAVLDFPVWILYQDVGNTISHSRGRLQDVMNIGIGSGPTYPAAVNSTVREAGVIKWIAMGNLLIPFNTTLSL